MATDPRGWRGLIEAGALFAAFMDLDEVLRQALPYSAGAARAERSRVLLHDAAAGELVVAAAGGAGGEQTRGQRFPDSSGVAGAVLRSGEPRIVAEPGGPMMAAPLRIGSRTLGVVEAMSPATAAAFQAADLERFTASCSLIAIAVENASLYRRLDRESQLLDRAREDHARPLVAESPVMRRALQQAERAAAGRSTVLLVGETGTGKEQLARRIHEASPRARRPFVALNCGALPEGLLESELFGHEKGAFTGADRRRIGRFELADGGTLFLDEIGELPAAAQVKLLRVLQEREITRLGGVDTLRVDVRLVVATHRDLEAEVRAGRFREDLFFRIHVVPIRLPPLRERSDDVEPLACLFVERLSRELGRPPRVLTASALDVLRRHPWPGNVRELENLIERLLVLGDEGPVTAEEVAELLPQASSAGSAAAADADRAPIGPASLWDQERQLLVRALEQADRNQTRAARLLQISREQLRTRMKRYGLLPSKPPAGRA